jgi:hypothetical protein
LFHRNTRDNIINIKGIHYWQPDHNLSGKGDACEVNGARYSKISRTASFSKDTTHFLVKNEYLQIDMRMFAQNKRVSDTKKQSLRYCNLPLRDLDDWGIDGKCTRTEKSETYNNYPHKVADYGFSHGSDPVPADDQGPTWRIPRWTGSKDCVNNVYLPGRCYGSDYPNVSTVSTQKRSSVTSVYWDWRKNFSLDFSEMDDVLYPAEIPEIPWGSHDDDGYHFKYTLSIGVKGAGNQYVNQVNNQAVVNGNYFYNTERYARSIRFVEDPKIGYHKIIPLNIPIDRIELMIYFDDWLRQLLLREILYRPWLSNDEFFKWSGTWKEDITNTALYINGETDFSAVAEKDRFLYGVSRNRREESIGIKYNYIDNSWGWAGQTVFENIPASLKPAGLSVTEETYFILMKNEDSGVYSLHSGTAGESLEEIMEFNDDFTDMTFIENGGTVYIAGNAAGFIEMFEIYQTESGGYGVLDIDSDNKPPSRTVFNVHSDETGIYLAGGGNTDGQTIEVKRDVWKFDTENGWQVLNSDTGNDLFKLFIRKQGDQLLLVSQTGLGDGNIAPYIILNSGTGDIEEEGALEIKGPGYEGGYIYDSEFCIYENNNSIFPGSINNDGYCVPVADYNYQTVYYPDYKRTVAGIGNSLYLGGLTGVRRVEIKEDGSLRNREMIFTGQTHNLAGHSDVLYGASGNRIYIYETDETGIITGTTSLSASSCTNLRVVDGMLFTAEKGRVRVFDLSDPLNPYLIKTIPTSGNVIDLEVVGNKLYIYEETVSWLFIVNGYTVVYDISDLNTPVMEKSFKKRCVDAEMQSSGDMIYLGCKNGQHRIDESGLVKVQGEKNFVREGYVYDGTLYQVFSGTLHKSETGSALPFCGNDIIEFGEVCDGDIVPCTILDPKYIGGFATCLSDCNGYDVSSCEVCDGWGC